MVLTIVDKGDCAVVVCLDDIVIYDTQAQQVWAETLIVLKHLTNASFLINVKKCKFLMLQIKMLGHVISSDC